MDSHTILRSSSGADFLAALPSLAGHTVPNSLLLVPFIGKRTFGAVRADLEPMIGECAEAVNGHLVDTLLAIPECDGAMIVLYPEQTFAQARASWLGHAAALAEMLARRGLRVVDIFCVATDGWGDLRDAGIPISGRPLAEIAASAVGEQAAAIAGAPSDLASELAFPEPEPSFAEALSTAVILLADFGTESDAFGRAHEVALPEPVAFLEGVLSVEPDDVPISDLARLVVHCARPDVRDQFIVQTAFGGELGRRVARANDWLAEREISEVDLRGELMTTAPASVHRAFEEGAERLMGLGLVRPARTRMDRMRVLLRRTILAVDGPDRCGPLTVLAWLAWATGRASVASPLIAQAIEADPLVTMPHTLRALFTSGRLPEWAFVIPPGASAVPT